MNEKFEEAFRKLNRRQREAVTTIEGPVLVIAGPGTGKTQLISTRAGHILKSTDSAASEILCLTFTNSGVAEMRERLMSLIGQEAYSLNIYTYHAFGSEIIFKNPEYFDNEPLEQVEELRQDMILRGIIAGLPYSNPLKFADSYIGDVKSFISESKQALLSPDDVEAVANHNLNWLKATNDKAVQILINISGINKKSLPEFEKLLAILETSAKTKTKLPKNVRPLASYMLEQLKEALDYFSSSGKTSLLTNWKNNWLEKDAAGNFIFKGKKTNEKMTAAAHIYRLYQESLRNARLYDYEDMILRAITALETHPDFKYSLSERYQYIMLDEFQDTNPAQMHLVELLTDHPVHEGRPNILAVGDDDQAIYAFQGADHANMAAFAKKYRQVKIISLEENYRSHQELIETGQAIARQIEQRLHLQFARVEKVLVAANSSLPKPPRIAAHEFKSDAAELAWVAKEMKKLVDKEDIAPQDIAALAPKHKYLIPLVPFLSANDLFVRYEKRENVLEQSLIRQLTQMSRLILALADYNETLANELWPEVLSYDFWAVPTETIWHLSWQAGKTHQPWTGLILSDKTLTHIANFFLRLKDLAPLTPLEPMLDGLIGLRQTTTNLRLSIESPMFEYHFGLKAARQDPATFVDLINSLSLLRSRLRAWAGSDEGPLDLRSFVAFVEAHQAANINILNESPYHEAENAVNLLTAYGAKGREFRAVFVLASQDEVWGSASRNQRQRLGLPANLQFIRYQGASEDERLRLLYVAVTRAKTHLYFTSHSQTLTGKATTRLKYLDISEAEGEPHSRALPAPYKHILKDEAETITPQTAEYYWSRRHLPPLTPKLEKILKPQLERYQLSPTHLNQFTDLERAGPEMFFLKSILGFPEAPTQTSLYGTAIHNTLRWLGGLKNRVENLPAEKEVIDFFIKQLPSHYLAVEQFELLAQKGRDSLHVWLEEAAPDLESADKYEYDFKDEGVFIDKVHLAGKVDRLIIDEKNKTVEVLDYKTGQAYEKWQSNVVKLHKFRQQLIMYKLLVEGSARFRGFQVPRGFIEFVEPNEEGKIVRLPLNYDEAEIDRIKRLTIAVWHHIQSLKFPDTKKYPAALRGIKAFEDDLIK